MKKWVYNVLIVFFSIVLVVSIGVVAKYYIEGGIQASRYQELSAMKDTESKTPRPAIKEDGTGTEGPDATVPAVNLVKVTDPVTGETVEVLPEFAELYKMNNEIVGWCTIPGTKIDYPVMQSPGDPEFYLSRNFDKKQSYRGCIFAQADCDIDPASDNIILYGHRMSDGSMFDALDFYTKESFYKEHPYIFFDTLRELHTYRIVAVFLTTASVGQGYSYHTFVNAESATDFQRYVSDVKAMSLYDTGVDATYGDKLITLSTCEYSQTNGRLVVVAKRIG